MHLRVKCLDGPKKEGLAAGVKQENRQVGNKNRQSLAYAVIGPFLII